MDILGITQCHYDGILAINLHSFSVKVCVHPSTNFTSLNILKYIQFSMTLGKAVI